MQLTISLDHASYLYALSGLFNCGSYVHVHWRTRGFNPPSFIVADNRNAVCVWLANLLGGYSYVALVHPLCSQLFPWSDVLQHGFC